MVSAEELRQQGAIVGGKREFIGRLREKIGAVQRRSPSDYNRAKLKQLHAQIASETAEVERLERGFEQRTGVPGSVQYSYRPRDFRGGRAKNIDRSQRGRTGVKFSQPGSISGGGTVTVTGTSRTEVQQQPGSQSPLSPTRSRDKFLLDPQGGVQENKGAVYVPLEQVEDQLRARQQFTQQTYVEGGPRIREQMAPEQRISKIQGFLFPPGVREDVEKVTGKSRRELSETIDMRTYRDRQVFDLSRSEPGTFSTGLKKRANVFVSDPVGSAIDTSKVAVVSAATGAGTGAVFKVGGTLLATRYGVGIARSAYKGAQLGMGAGFAGGIGVSAYTDPEGFGYQATDLVIGGVGFMKGFKGTAPTRTVTTRMPQQVKTTETFIDLPGGQVKTTGKGRAFVEVKEFGQTTVAAPEVTITATQPFTVQGKQTTPVRVSVRGGTDLVSFNRDFAGYARFNEATGQTRYALTAGVGKTRTTVDILQSKPTETTLRPGEGSYISGFQSQTFIGSTKPQALTPFEGVSKTDRISYKQYRFQQVTKGKTSTRTFTGFETIRPPKSFKKMDDLGYSILRGSEPRVFLSEKLTKKQTPDVYQHERGHVVQHRMQPEIKSLYEKGHVLQKRSPDKEIKTLQREKMIEDKEFFDLYKPEVREAEYFAEVFKARELYPDKFKKAAPEMERFFQALGKQNQIKVLKKQETLTRQYQFSQSPIAKGGGSGKGTVVVRGAVRTGYEPYTLLPEQQPTFKALQPVKGFESFSLLQEKGLYKEPMSTRARGKVSGLREQASSSFFPKGTKRLYSGVGLERVEPVRPGKITQPQGTFGKTTRPPFPVAGVIVPAQYAKLGNIGVFAFGQKSVPGAKYSVSRGTYALTTPRSTKPIGKQGKKQTIIPATTTMTPPTGKGFLDLFDTGRPGGGGSSFNDFPIGLPPSKVTPPPPGFGALPLFGPPAKSKKRGKGRTRGFEYQPSLAAGILNIKGKKSKGTLTGLEIRPLQM